MKNCILALILQDFPKFEDFIVAHDYLVTPNSEKQARVRRRGQNGKRPRIGTPRATLLLFGTNEQQSTFKRKSEVHASF